MHFGSTLRLLRVDAGFSVRELARRIGVSSAYVSRVENGWDAPPTPDRLAAVADALGLSRSALVELAGQAGPALDEYLVRVPAAGALMLEIADRNVDIAGIAKLRAFLDQEFPARRARSGVSLGALMPPDGVVTGFIGSSLRDIVDVAVARLPESTVDLADVAETLMRREEQASSCVGGGVFAPHAVIPGAVDGVVVVTTGRPLPVVGPDGQPIRVGVLLVSGQAGASYLELLSRAARIGTYGVAEELCAASTPAAVRVAIQRLEMLW